MPENRSIAFHAGQWLAWLGSLVVAGGILFAAVALVYYAVGGM